MIFFKVKLTFEMLSVNRIPNLRIAECPDHLMQKNIAHPKKPVT